MSTKPTMTGRQRLTAALRGQEVDRVPLHLPFPIIDGPAAADHFSCGWQADPLYRELFDYVRPYGDVLEHWWYPPLNRYLMTARRHISVTTEEVSPDLRRRRETIRVPDGELNAVIELQRNHATDWVARPMVHSADDVRRLIDLPFDIAPADVAAGRENCRQANARIEDQGVAELFLSAPNVCISGAMPFETFLELTITENRLIHDLCAEINRRILRLLEALLAEGPLDTIVTFGGSEQCTPPMLPPQAYEEFVQPYQGRLIRWLQDRGYIVKIHCHGKVRHALSCMLAEGADATDPLEPPPQGDVTYAEARQIVGDRLTFMGNLEHSELACCPPDDIRRQVKDILALGNRRLILAESAGPMGRITPQLAANYRAWVDAAVEYGG